MYNNNKQQIDKFRFHQQFPYHSSCNPATLKVSGRVNPHPTDMAPRAGAVVVPIFPNYPDEDDAFSEKGLLESSPESSSSSWWSWTFGIVMAPLLLWGCPFYLWTMSVPPSYYPQIRSSRIWLKRIFDCSSAPCLVILTSFLILLTTLSNAYLLYLLGMIINDLFIRGVYEVSMFKEIVNFARDIPVIIMLNYVWLLGFKINNIISHLNRKYRKYRHHVSCTRFRLSVLFMVLAIICLHTIRFVSFKMYEGFYDQEVQGIIKNVWGFSTDIFLTLLLPLYCTFCFAVRFELFIIKSVIYESISKRVTPNVGHLSKFKTLYTHAADHIDIINGFFSFYLSLVIGLIIISTMIDAEGLFETVAQEIMNAIISNLFNGEGKLGEKITKFFKGDDSDESGAAAPPQPLPTPTGPPRLAPAMVRSLNANIVCLAIVYSLVLYTVWQAVVTNDYVRELHVWLNDFVAGAGGSDAEQKLMEVGADGEVRDDGTRKIANIVRNNDSFDGGKGVSYGGGGDIPQLPLLWGRNKPLRDGDNDQFLEKFKMLKAYIHVRLQLEKPSMLNIALVGVFVPTLSGRLKRYNILF